MGRFGIHCKCSEDELSACDRCYMHCLYSDLHKEAYGVRARGDYSEWTSEDFQAAIDRLPKYEPESDDEIKAILMPMHGKGWTLVYSGCPFDARERMLSQAEIWI